MRGSKKLSDMFFLIGLRRSRTTILKKLVEQSPDRPKICFEPHDFYYAMAMSPMKRYRNYRAVRNDYAKKYDGFKFALNPGICALEWKVIPQLYPQAKFVFIVRNISATYNSYYKQDVSSYRGVIAKDAYQLAARDIIAGFTQFVGHNKNQALLIEDQELLDAPDQTMNFIWDFLNLTQGPSIRHLIKV